MMVWWWMIIAMGAGFLIAYSLGVVGFIGLLVVVALWGLAEEQQRRT